LVLNALNDRVIHFRELLDISPNLLAKHRDRSTFTALDKKKTDTASSIDGSYTVSSIFNYQRIHHKDENGSSDSARWQ
jgi:hypothetical protein